MCAILSQAEIRELTLYKQKRKQIETLMKMGIPFYIHPVKGKPIVTTSAVNVYKNSNSIEDEPNWAEK